MVDGTAVVGGPLWAKAGRSVVFTTDRIAGTT